MLRYSITSRSYSWSSFCTFPQPVCLDVADFFSPRYPSLLESSDVEGGSTAAVLTYLYRILDSIEQDDLVHRILHFLLASPSGFESKSAQKSVDMSMSRRKSLDVLAAFSEEAARPSPSLFNLRDLALLGLQSKNRQTVLATLRLMAVVLQRHHTFARSLIRTLPGQPAEQRTVGALNAELGQLVTLATSVVDDPMLEESFEDYLKDASLILESRLCIPADDDLGEDQPLEIRQDDPICQELLNCLEEFFANSVIVNLALTEVLMSIASSHLLSLDGWLLVDPSKYEYSDSPSPEDANVMEQIQFAYTEPSWSSDHTPTLTSVLQKLVQQIQEWRKEIPDFDILIAARRDLLHNEDDPTSPQTSQQASGIQSPVGGASERPRPNIDTGVVSPRGRTPRPLKAHGMSPSPHRAAVASPLRDASLHMPPSRDSESQTSAAEELRKRLFQPFIHGEQSAKDANNDGSTETGEQEDEESAVSDSEPSSATLGHVLTNVVILYEFILEISAMVQARGTLFEEAGYPGVMSEQEAVGSVQHL